MYKKIFISILILLILFLGLVSVSAAEFDNGSDFTIDDMDKYSLAIGDSEFEDTLSIGKESLDVSVEYAISSKTSEELDEIISNANNNSFIELNDDYNVSSQITIQNDMAIDGKGHVLDGNCQTRIFKIPLGVVVKLYNIKFVNCNGYQHDDWGNDFSEGGAIYNKGSLTINNCSFIDCNTDFNLTCGPVDSVGGAIYNGGNMSIDNSIFMGCYVNYNSSILSIGSGGGAIYNNGSLNICNCDFIDCYANSYASISKIGSGGGAIENEFLCVLNIVNCSFINCRASSFSHYNKTSGSNSISGGGAVSNSGKMTISDCNFINCSSNSSGNARGGAIFNVRQFSLDGCSFINCSSFSFGYEGIEAPFFSSGGAIYSVSDYFSDVVDCSFTGCTSISITSSITGRAYGGAIYCHSSIMGVYSCDFNNCSSFISYCPDKLAESDGGAIYGFASDLDLDDCSFVGCSSNYTSLNFYSISRGGAIYKQAGNLTVRNCIFSNNSAFDGSAIYNCHQNFSIIKSVLINNYGNYTICDEEGDNISSINNWWGTNNPANLTNFDIGQWVVMTVSTKPSVLSNIKEPLTITVDFNHFINSNGEVGQLKLPLKNVILEFQSNGGKFTNNRAIVVNGVASTKYYPIVGQNIINIISGNESRMISFSQSNENTYFVTTKTSIKASPNYGYVKLTLRDSKGKPIANKQVKYTFNGKLHTTYVNAKGKVAIKISVFKAKNYKILVKFAGDIGYKSSTFTKTIKVVKNSVKFFSPIKKVKKSKSKKTFKITLKTSNKKALSKKYVYLKINRKTYNVKTNAKGVATFKLKLPKSKKTYKYKVSFKGDKGNYKKTYSGKLKVY